MRRILVVVLALLAGCSGVFGAGAGTDGTTVTPAPVPTAGPSEVGLPQMSDGTPAVGRILASHRRALSTRDFHRSVVVDGTLSRTDVWVDRDADRTRVRRETTRTTDIVLSDGRLYERRADGTVSSEPAGDDLPFVETPSGFHQFQQYVAGLVYTRTGTVTRNGTRLAVLRANTTDATISRSGSRTVVAADSTLYVDRNGIVRAMNHRERYAGGTVRTLRVRVETGPDSVTMPPWFTDDVATATP